MDVQLSSGCDAPQCFDLSMHCGDLSTENELNNAIMMSLFTDRRANNDDVLPTGQTDRRGWWSDALDGEKIGSKLWLLEGATNRNMTKIRAKEYAQESLMWLVNDAVAKSVNVTVSIGAKCNDIYLNVDVCKSDDERNIFKYRYAWDNLNFENCLIEHKVC